MTLISIIIPSFNTKKLLQNCLRSIYQQTPNISFEIIIVDNGSKYNIKNQIAKFKKKLKADNIKLIQNKENLGYAKANNQGIHLAKGDYILFLNSDTLILSQAIEKSVNFMVNNKKVDILGCKLLNRNKTIQPSGGYFPSLKQVFFTMFFIDDLPFIKKIIKPYQVVKKNFYQYFQNLDWVSGAFILVKKKVIDKIGGFDNDFFMYAEEIDFCFRAKKAGFKVGFYPNAQIIHLKGKSSKNGFNRAVWGEFIGLKKLFQKHQPKWQLPVLRFLLKTGAFLRIIIFAILKQNNKKKTYEKAFKLA